jgi:hypothetical protein
VHQNSCALRSSDFNYDTISFSGTHINPDSPFTLHIDIMTSSVFYKFKSQKEPTRLEFDGTGISVFELKRDIIIKSGLGDGTDFDLAVFTDDGKEGKFGTVSSMGTKLTVNQNMTMTLLSFLDPPQSSLADCLPLRGVPAKPVDI